MKISLFIPCFLYFLLFLKGVKSDFTKDDCLLCCDGLPREDVDACKHSCIKKFSSRQKVRERAVCISGCRKIVEECRRECITDCLERFPYRLRLSKKEREENSRRQQAATVQTQ